MIKNFETAKHQLPCNWLATKHQLREMPMTSASGRKWLALAILVSFGLHAWADDAPNTKVEKKLSEKNNAIMSTPAVDPGVWNMVTSQTSSRSYTTQKKESLMEISQMLFGDSHFWSKLWALNKSISNPYEVPAGTTISLESPSTDEPPSIGVLFNAFPDRKQLGEMAGPDLLGSTLNTEIPPNSHDRPNPASDLPPVFPEWRYRKDVSKLTTTDLSRPIVNIPEAIKNLDYFVMESFPESEGAVIGTELHLKSAAEYQYIYVKLDHEPKAKDFLVMKNLGRVESEFSKSPPTVVEILGAVQVLDKVDDGKDTYRAIVTKSLDNVSVGASLVLGTLPTYVFSSGAVSTANATIIGGQHNTLRHFFGVESIVFLDKGKSGGIAEGQFLPVYQYQRAHLDNKFIKKNPRIIGKLKVVKAMENYSTAVVIESIAEIEVGDATSPNLSAEIESDSDSEVKMDAKAEDRPEAKPETKADSELDTDLSKPDSEPKSDSEPKPDFEQL